MEVFGFLGPLKVAPDPQIPDFRDQLANHSLFAKDTLTRTFTTSHETGIYKVVVEGLSESGKVLYGKTEFNVVLPPNE